MDKILENQASNQAFGIAGEWHWSKKDAEANRMLESEKKFVLLSYSNRPEFAEKFESLLNYYMVKDNYIKQLNMN